MASTPRKTPYGSQLTDASVTTAASTVTAQGTAAATEGARADAAADRVEASEDDARAHAQNTTSFVSIVDGLTYEKGAKGFAADADADRVATAASEAAAAASETNAAQSEAVAAAAAANLTLGAVDHIVADATARDAIASPTSGDLALVYEEGLVYRYNGSAWAFAYDGNAVSVSSYAALANAYGAAGSVREVVEDGRAGTFDHYADWATAQAAYAWAAALTEAEAKAAGLAQDAATDASAVWVRRWGGGTLPAPWAGAEGDGATDDSAALQAAYDALYAIGGGSLYLPAGRYLGSWATAHYNDSTTDAAGVVGVRIYGDGQETVLTLNSAVPATYVGNVITDHSQCALKVFGSNNIIENLAFDDCPVGLYMGQDPDNTAADINDLSFCSFNRVQNVWVTNCGTGVLMQPGLGNYYNTFQRVHGEDVQYGFHLAPGYDEGVTHASSLTNNRNTFEDCRFTRAWVGWLNQNGDTNSFVRCHGEGIQVTKTGKIGATPPSFIRKSVGTLTSDASGAITSLAITSFDSGLERGRMEDNRYLWLETGGAGEYVQLNGSAADAAATVTVDAVTLARTYPAGTTVYEATPTAHYEDQDAYGYGLSLNHWTDCHCEAVDRALRYDSYGSRVTSCGFNVQRRVDIVDRLTTTWEHFLGNYASDGMAGLMAGNFRVFGHDSGLPGYDGFSGATAEYIRADHASVRDRGYDVTTYDVATNLTGGTVATPVSGSVKSDYFSLGGVCRWRCKFWVTPDAGIHTTENPLTLAVPLPPDDFYYTNAGSGGAEFRVPITVEVDGARQHGSLRFVTGGTEADVYPPEGVNWRSDSANLVQFEIEYRWDPEA